MVVAGPGTGKTELLSMRVANILRTTDALPANILCLTFTESGASAMRQRLVGLIGRDAYKVAIHTFHSFGSEIINHHAEYFYHGAHFRPADQLSSYEILTSIFEALPHDSLLAGKMEGTYTHLRDVQSTISDLKKSGLTPDEVGLILDRNDAFAAWVQPRLEEAWAPRLSKKSFATIEQLALDVANYSEEPYALITYRPLYQLVGDSLGQAIAQAQADDSTKPLSAWKKRYVEKREDGQHALKDERVSRKLRAAIGIYYDYLVRMQERGLYDFDDMILRVVHATEVFAELRYNLQEQYQYVLVDEFQDTNDAQMRLAWNLTNNPSSEGRPNIMVVGDDDQAIYRFQGANISNILGFKDLYRDVARVVLTDNYRSAAPVLKVAREVIVQGSERLEDTLPDINKTLTPHRAGDAAVRYDEYETESDEYQTLALRIARDIEERPDATRAIIARHHRQLMQLMPHLQAAGIPLTYERRDNALELEPIMQLELLAQVVQHMADREFGAVDELLPQLLAHPSWGVAPEALWQLSLGAYRQRVFWLEAMMATPGRLHDIAEWLVVSSHFATYQPVEFMLDHLFGSTDLQVSDDASADADEPFRDGPVEDFVSPLRAYFFPADSLSTNPAQYIAHLHALQALRQRIREYRPDSESLLLSDFVSCLDLHHELGITITSGSGVESATGGVTLLTAHKSKGLEYDEVYIVSLTDSIWGSTARSRSPLITFPTNLPLAVSGNDSDEQLRLLYVALTRARERLFLSAHRTTVTERRAQRVGALTGASIDESMHELAPPHLELRAALTDWRAPLLGITPATMSELLTPTLERYRLSATHLAHYLDVTRGGPELFLLQNLLRFPQAMNPQAAYGSSIHTALQRAHAHLAATGTRRPVEDVLHDFEEALASQQLSEEDTTRLLKRGSDTLHSFLAQRYNSFMPTQVVERRFDQETIMIGDARIGGAIDLMDIDEETKTITVTDYKTGKAARSWRGTTEYEKLKLHHYRQQLMFYKLLIEGSRHFADYTVTTGVIEFVEPTHSGDILRLEYSFDAGELAEFSELIGAVWHAICDLQFTLPEGSTPTLSGVLHFEQQLRDNGAVAQR